MTKHLTNIPFTGFYESEHASMIDDEINMIFETDDNGGTHAVPDDLYKYADYKGMFTDYAKLYAEVFADHFEEETGVKLDLEFESMTSPKFYNFETDRIFAHISTKAIQDMFTLSEDENHISLKKVIADRHTSRSGFHSFYSNDPEEWLSKSVTDWDNIELETLIHAVYFSKTGKGVYEDDDMKAWSLMDRARGNGKISGIVEEHIKQIMFDFADYQRQSGKEQDFKEWLMLGTRKTGDVQS